MRLVQNVIFTKCCQLITIFGDDVLLGEILLALLDGMIDVVLSNFRVLLFGALILIVEAPLHSIGREGRFDLGLLKPRFISHWIKLLSLLVCCDQVCTSPYDLILAKGLHSCLPH